MENLPNNFDWQSLVNVLFTAVTFALGWMFKNIFTNIKENQDKNEELYDKLMDHQAAIQKDLTALALSIPEKYLRKDDFKAFADRMDERFDRIDEKLENLR